VQEGPWIYSPASIRGKGKEKKKKKRVLPGKDSMVETRVCFAGSLDDSGGKKKKRKKEEPLSI